MTHLATSLKAATAALAQVKEGLCSCCCQGSGAQRQLCSLSCPTLPTRPLLSNPTRTALPCSWNLCSSPPDASARSPQQGTGAKPCSCRCQPFFTDNPRDPGSCTLPVSFLASLCPTIHSLLKLSLQQQTAACAQAHTHGNVLTWDRQHSSSLQRGSRIGNGTARRSCCTPLSQALRAEMLQM